MIINNGKFVYVFDQDKDKWFRWSYTSLKFIEVTKPLNLTLSTLLKFSNNFIYLIVYKYPFLY